MHERLGDSVAGVNSRILALTSALALGGEVGGPSLGYGGGLVNQRLKYGTYPESSPTNHLCHLDKSHFLSSSVMPRYERGPGQVISDVPSASDILSLGSRGGTVSGPQLSPCSLMPPCLSAPRAPSPQWPSSLLSCSTHLPSAVRLLRSRSGCKRQGMSRGSRFFLISPGGRRSWGAQPDSGCRGHSLKLISLELPRLFPRLSRQSTPFSSATLGISLV